MHGNYIEYNVNSNNKDSKFQVGDHLRTSKYKNIFVKYTPNWSEIIFVIKKVKNAVPWTYILLIILMVNKLLEHFTKKNCKKKKRIKKNLE